MPTKALSCKKEAVFEHGPDVPSRPVGQDSFKWTVSKWESDLWSDESKFDILVSNHRHCVLLAKEEGDLPASYSVQKPASLMVWGFISTHGMGSLHVMERTMNAERYIKGVRAKYAPLQMTSMSGKALCISAEQRKPHTAAITTEKSQGAELTCLQSGSFTNREHLVHH